MDDLNDSFCEQNDQMTELSAAAAAVQEHSAPEQKPLPTAQPPEEEEPHKPEKPHKVVDTSVMRVRSFMGALILLGIPVVNFICAITWTFRRGNNRNRRNLGIAALLLQLIFIALLVGACVVAKYQFGYDLVGHMVELVANRP